MKSILTVAFFDIAGTLVQGDPWNDLLTHPTVDRSRVRLAYARVLPVWLGKKVGIIDDIVFRDRWIHAMAGIFKGWSQARLVDLFRWVATDAMKNAYQDAVLARLRQHKQAGDQVILVSGLFDTLVQAFADALGADAAIGSTLVFHNGVCAGEISGRTMAGTQKIEAIADYLKSHRLSAELSTCYAYADSWSDVSLLEGVGHPVATFPDPALKAIARQRGWTILPS